MQEPTAPLKTIFPESSLAKRAAIAALRLYGKTLPKNPPPFPPPGDAEVKILIQSMGGIGNTLMATPLIHATRELYPKARIDVLTSPGAAELLKKEPDIDSVISEQEGNDYSKTAYWRMIRDLYRSHYDAALLTLNAVTFRFAARSVLARVPIRLIHEYAFQSHDDFTSAFSKVIPKRSEAHDVECNLDLLRFLSGTSTEAGPLRIHLDDSEITEARQVLLKCGYNPERQTVAVCPGSSGWMSFKRWPLGSYIGLVKKLLINNENLNVLCFSGPDEKDEVDQWIDSVQSERFFLVRGLGLRTYAAAIKWCDVIVTNDSLPMHLAAALQRPVVALFGPTDPKRTAPWMCRSTVLCSPADFVPYFRIPYSPAPDQFPPSMDLITVDSVYKATLACLP